MTDLEYIVNNLSDEDILCSISEESAELAKAALKLRRALTKTDPTPVTVDEAKANLFEEYSDVLGSFWVYTVKHNCKDDVDAVVIDNINDKVSRRAQRIKECKKHD